MKRLMLGIGVTMTAAAILSSSVAGQDQRAALDTTVQAFLERHRGTWHDLNVPESDGRILHDLILKHKFTRALEIGTSTGHSGIWIAWALAKTGGKLTTVEIKVIAGGCFTAHNVAGRGAGAGIREFLDHLQTLSDAVTTIDKTSRAGISISCKR